MPRSSHEQWVPPCQLQAGKARRHTLGAYSGVHSGSRTTAACSSSSMAQHNTGRMAAADLHQEAAMGKSPNGSAMSMSIGPIRSYWLGVKQ